MSKALFIGRFQPFHKGHLYDIKLILRKHSKVIIAIGSANKSRTFENPWTARERIEMIRACLSMEKVSDKAYEFVLLDDMPDDNMWIKKLQKKIQHFDAAYSGNEYVINLLRNAGIKVKRLKLLPKISGTVIRERMKHAKPWRHMVPEGAQKVLGKHIEHIR